MVFKINNEVVNVLNAPLISETLDETLDSGSMVLAFSDIENAIAPMSVVSITDDANNVLSFLVSSDIVSIGSKDPMKYVHNLTIIQNTRKFAKTQVRNTVFSQPAKPILTAYSNGLYYDTSTQTTMTRPLGLSSIANTCEVSIKNKIKRAFISFKIVEIENKTTNQMPKLTSTINRITFNVFKGSSSIVAVNLSNVNSDTIYELPLTNFVGGIDYSIGNVVVYSSATPTGNYFAIDIKLNIETYIYTLFDVLETLNNQIALDEYEETGEVYAPSINVTYTYVPSSSGYECSFKITNPNTFEVTINYSTTGSWVKSGTLTIPARGTSASIILGNGNSGEQGTISAYATYNGVNSDTTKVYYALSSQLQPPVLSWATDSIYGSRAILTNNNKVDVKTYYKFYIQGASVDFSNMSLTAYGGHDYASGWYNNKRVYYEYYSVNETTGEESTHVSGNIIIGNLPSMADPVFRAPTVTIGDFTYVVSSRITNNNNFDVKCYSKINNNYYTTDTILANSYIDITKNEPKTSGSNGTLSAYFTADNYLDSSVVSVSWEAKNTLQALVIVSANMVSATKLRIVYTNPNNVNATGTFYANGEQYKMTGVSWTKGENFTKDFTIDVNNDSYCYVGILSADGWNDSADESNKVNYTAYEGGTLATPSIEIVKVVPSGSKYNVTYKVTNNDSVTINCYAGISRSLSSSDYQGQIAGGQSANYIYQSSSVSGTIYVQGKATGFDDSGVNSVNYAYVPLQAVTINSATIIKSGSNYYLSVNYTNPNSVSVSTDFYCQGGAQNITSVVLSNGTHTYTTSDTVVNMTSSCWFSGFSADNFESISDSSNTANYSSAGTGDSIFINGNTSVSVGNSITIYVTDADNNAISGVSVSGSDDSVATVTHYSGTQYVVTGVSSGTITITASASGYATATRSITIT